MIALLLLALGLALADEPAPAPEPVAEPAPAPAPEPAAAAAPAPAPKAPPAPPWQRKHWGWGGVPALNYNSDEGFGFGLLASIYRYDGTTNPYKLSFTFLFFMTTRSVHSHRIDMDWVDVGGTPLRLQARIQLKATNTANFCGYGWDVSCDPAVAEQAADTQGLTGTAREDFIRHYYYARWLRPNGYLLARYRISTGKPKIELFAGWRGEEFLSRFWKDPGPYPGSLYDTTVGAEDGFLSVVQVGAMMDKRDNEPAPRRGYWNEVSLRAAPKFLGSAWQYVGFNGTFRFYAPLVPKNGILTLASRTVLDGFWGDANVHEFSQVGGSQVYNFGGGAEAGRGIRLRRFIGRAKAMEQLELRYAFVRFRVVKANTEITALAFLDSLVAAAEWNDLGPAFAHPAFGEGIGFRFAFNENFIIRADVGFSAVENWSPGIYIDVDHLF